MNLLSLLTTFVHRFRLRAAATLTLCFLALGIPCGYVWAATDPLTINVAVTASPNPVGVDQNVAISVVASKTGSPANDSECGVWNDHYRISVDGQGQDAGESAVITKTYSTPGTKTVTAAALYFFDSEEGACGGAGQMAFGTGQVTFTVATPSVEVPEPDLPRLIISFPYAQYLTGTMQEVWVAIAGPDSLKGHEYDVTIVGQGQTQIIPLTISDDFSKSAAAVFVDMPTVVGNVTFGASLQVDQSTIYSHTTAECIDSFIVNTGGFTYTALDSINATIEKALAKAVTNPAEALDMLNVLLNTSVDTGRNKILIRGAIAVITAYEKQMQNGRTNPLYQINAKTWIDVCRSLPQNIVDKMADCLTKGTVGPRGETGINVYPDPGMKVGGVFYKYAIKVLGSGGDWRIYGNAVDVDGKLVIIFDKFRNH